MKNNKFIYSVKCEGENEFEFIKKLKSEIFCQNKTISLCKNKTHSKLINGTINENIIKDTKNCCTSFIILDQDNLSDKKIDDLNMKAKKEKVNLIITYPCFELILLSLFIIDCKIFEKKKIEEKLAQIINVEKYKHSIDNIKKIFNKAFSSESKKEITLNIFEKNLEYLNKIKESNFILLYRFLKGDK